MKFLDTDNVCVKQRRAKLLLDFEDLIRQSPEGRVTLAQWNRVRGHSNWDAARQDLTRYRKTLADFGVRLEFGNNDEGVFEVDLKSRGLRALVSREIGAAVEFLQERNKVDGEGALSHDDDSNLSGTCLHCGKPWRIPIEELLTGRSHVTALSPMRELRREFQVDHRRLRRILRAEGIETRPAGGQPMEAMRPKDDVAKALQLARSKGPFKRKVLEIAELLDCSPRTARRFIERAKGGKVSSSHR